jgi:hypothetical protein
MNEFTGTIESHPQFDADRVELALVTNGTISSEAIAGFVNEHNILFGISCDRPPLARVKGKIGLERTGSV